MFVRKQTAVAGKRNKYGGGKNVEGRTRTDWVICKIEQGKNDKGEERKKAAARTMMAQSRGCTNMTDQVEVDA